MLVNISFMLMTLVVQGVPSSLGFQSRSLFKNHRASHPSGLVTDNSISPKYEKNSNVRATTSVSYRSPEGQEWIDKSVKYYATVMRTERGSLSTSSEHDQSLIAKRLYHAIQQVRSGNLSRAEHIYRKTIRDINEDGCSNADLATTTLLLALVLQRMGNIGEARMVFHRFFRTAMSTAEKDPHHQCHCTGKILGAYALFEMRHGSVHRSFELARRASQFDETLSSILSWKQFRDAEKKIMSRSPIENYSITPCSVVTEVNLPAEAGDFRLRAYRISTEESKKQPKLTGTEPSVIYYASKPPLGTNGKGLNDVPIRIHSSSVKCAIFESERCKYKEQLELSMEYIREHGGAIIYFEPEAESTSSAHGVSASVADSQYSVIPSLLEDMGIESIRLVSNSPSMVRKLRKLGVDVRGTVPLVVKSSIENYHGTEFTSRVARDNLTVKPCQA